MKKTGILGGTFNPIHTGHLILAETARSAFGLDQVYFIPSGRSYMKKQSEILDARTRMEMVQLSVQGNPYFQVLDIEINKPGNSYTCETLEQLCSQEPDTEFYDIIGADTLYMMEKWYCPERIFEHAVILAAVRDGASTVQLEQQIAHLQEKYNARIFLLPTGDISISSTMIRQNRREGKSVRYLVPDAVLAYMEQKQLYCER